MSLSFFFSLRAAAPPDIKFHLQRLDVLKFVGVPLFDLLIFPRCEEQMSLGDELEEHDAAGKTREEREVTSSPAKIKAEEQQQHQRQEVEEMRWKISWGEVRGQLEGAELETGGGRGRAGLGGSARF